MALPITTLSSQLIIHTTYNGNKMKLERDNVVDICGGSDQVLVYGWKSCLYQDLRSTLSCAANSPIREVFDWELGVEDLVKKTLEGRVIEKIKSGGIYIHQILRCCKAALVNVVLENYKREKEGLTLLRVIFCVAHNDLSTFSAKLIASKKPDLNCRHTHSELRRAYKLCCEVENSQLRAIAEKTFVFVMLSGSVATEVDQLKRVDPFWKQPDWEGAWALRRKWRVSFISPKKWSNQLEAKVADYERGRTSSHLIT